jgi:hypothetical protein
MKQVMEIAFAGSALAVLCSAVPAQAADYGFCRTYARAAVEQFAQAEANPYCASRIGGPRWHPNYEVHFNWCLAAAPWDVRHEWDARSRTLFHCTRGM